MLIIGGATIMNLERSVPRCGGHAEYDFIANRAVTLTNGVSTIALAPGWSYSRTGTRFSDDYDGFLTSFGANVPRITDKGLAVHSGATNLLTYSEQFDNAAWTKARASIAANAATAPDGTTTAEKLVEDTTAGATHYALQTYTKAASSIQYTASVYAKAAEREGVLLWFADASLANAARVSFQLSDGTVGGTTVQGTGWTLDDYTIEDAGDGWYRCTVTATTGTETTATLLIGSAPTGASVGNAFYNGDGTSGIYLWGAQLETGSVATPYIPTTASSASAGADAAVIDVGLSGGLWTNIGNLDPSNGFTVLVEFLMPDVPTGAFPVSIGLGTSAFGNDDTLYLNASQSELVYFVARTGGTTVANQLIADFDPGDTVKIALGWDGANTISASANGSAISEDTSAALDPAAIDVLRFGVNNATNYLQSYVRRVTIIEGNTTDAQKQALST